MCSFVFILYIFYVLFITLFFIIIYILSINRIFSGSLDVKMAPKAVTQREESELQAMLDRLAMEQEEVDGDAPEDA